MPTIRYLTILVACALGFGLAGGVLGLILGVSAPDYYQGVFRAGDDPGFDPARVGLGLGLTQGVILGGVVGSVLVLALAIAGSGASGGKGEPAWPAEPELAWDRAVSKWTWRVLVLAALLATTSCGGAVGFVVGGITGEMRIYQRYVDAKLAKIRPLLQEPQFAGVEADYSSLAQVCLSGAVETEQAREELEARLRFLFGDEEARSMLAGVSVAKE